MCQRPQLEKKNKASQKGFRASVIVIVSSQEQRGILYGSLYTQ